MKVAVVGAGAIGAHVGAALHRAGAEVHLIARGPHPAAMRRDGVRVLGARGGFTAHPAATIEACPTGALSFGTGFDMRAAGTWDEPARTETTAVCTSCGVGCNVTLHVQDNEIVKVASPHDNPVTHGNLCIKGRFGFQHVQNRV